MPTETVALLGGLGSSEVGAVLVVVVAFWVLVVGGIVFLVLNANKRRGRSEAAGPGGSAKDESQGPPSS